MPPTRGFEASNWRVKGTVGSRPLGDSLERDRRVRKEQRVLDEPGRDKSEGTRIYVGNLSYTVQKSDVERLFDEAGYDVVNIDISIDPFTARNPSYCFVDLVSVEAATSAMHNLNGEEFFGRPLKIKPCVQKRDSSQRVQAEGVIFDRWKHGPSRGSESHDHLRQPALEGRRVYVGGLSKPLDTLTSDTELRELFKDFKVVGVSKVKSPRENHRPGNHFYAFVDLESKEEAENAIKRLNGTMVFGQTLKVNLATSGSGRDLFEGVKRKETTRHGNQNQESSVDLPC